MSHRTKNTLFNAHSLNYKFGTGWAYIMIMFKIAQSPTSITQALVYVTVWSDNRGDIPLVHLIILTREGIGR